jgi:hypothetical protein
MIKRITLTVALYFLMLSSAFVSLASFQQRGTQQLPTPRQPGSASVPGAVDNLPHARPIDGVSVMRERNDSIEYSINNPRPLEQTATLLRRKLGVPVSYEDPAWSFSGDVVYSADLPANRHFVDQNPNWRGPRVPRGGIFEATLPRNASAADPFVMINAVVASYPIRNNPGLFKVVKFGDNEYSIVGIGAANSDGRVVQQTAPFDRRVSFPEEERTLADTLDLICKPINVMPMVQYYGGRENSSPTNRCK